MADSEIKRTEKGQFPPGVSGNPTGRRKDGQQRAPKPSPISDMRELLEVSQYNEDVQGMVAPVLGTLLTMAQPHIIQLAFQRAQKDNRILAILLQYSLNNMDRHNAKQKDRPPKDLNQLTLELEELKQNQGARDLFTSLGVNVDELNILEMAKNIEAIQNPLSSSAIPAQGPENSREKQENEKQIPENANQKTDD